MSLSPALRLLRPLVRLAEREAGAVVAFIKRRYTPLAVLALFLAGGALFFIGGYMFRYSHWNWWLWKSRAASKTLYFGALLIAIKLLLGSL